MPKATAKHPAPPVSYEAAERELAELVQRLESGDLPLEDLLQGYRRGTQLLAYCRERLQAVEEQIQVIEFPPEDAPDKA